VSDFSGNIFSGTFEQMDEVFYLKKVKHLPTRSVLSEHQLNQLNNYLKKQSESCMITVNDQMPILLQKEEISQLLLDIENIQRTLEQR